MYETKLINYYFIFQHESIACIGYRNTHLKSKKKKKGQTGYLASCIKEIQLVN